MNLETDPIRMSTPLILLPILIPLTGSAVALLLRRYRRVQPLFAFFTMLLSFAISLAAFFHIWRYSDALIFQVGLWQAPFGISIIGDPLSITFVVMSQLVIGIGILYALGAKDQCVRYPAFYPLFLTLAAGLTGTFLTGDFFNLFVFAELLVASSAILTAISDDKNGVEAAFKYFFMSLIASIFLLISISIAYVSYGTLNLADLATRIAQNPEKPLLFTGIIFLLAFFMVKSAVVPFHFWLPDFHTTAPTPISAMLSSVVVKLGVYGALRMTTLLFTQQAEMIQQILLVLGIVGVFFGGLGAVRTHNLKRTLAYSTIGQLGFIFAAIGWGSPFALAAVIVFTFNHSLIKSAMLMLAGAMASRAPVKSADFSVITGLGKTAPVAGVLFLIGGMGLAGLPPTNGFVSKLSIFQSGLVSHQYLSVAFLVFGSLISLIYVGRSFIRVWWQPADNALGTPKTGDRLVAPLLLIILCLVFGIVGESLIRLAEWNVIWLSQPSNYIQVVLGN